MAATAPGRPDGRVRSLLRRTELDRPAVLAVLLLLVAVTSGPSIQLIASGGRILSQNDLGWHLRHALSFPLWPPEPPAPYFLFHVTVRFVDAVVPLGPATAAGITMSMFRVASACAIYVVLRGGLRDGDPAASRWPALGGTAMLLVLESPRILLVGTSISQGHAFIPLQTLFSPTNQTLLPFAVITPSVLAVFLRQTQERRLSPTASWGTFGLLLVGVLAKPSFAFCLLPMVPLWAWARSGTDRWRVAWTTVVRLCLPIAAVLALQAWYLSFILPPDRQGGFTWGPFSVATAWGVDKPILWLSLIVPTIGVLVAGRRWLASPVVSITLAGAVFGILQFLLLTETGARANDGNLGWGAEMCIVVLTVHAVRWLVSTHDARRTTVRWRLVAAWAIAGVATLSGVVAVVTDAVLR